MAGIGANDVANNVESRCQLVRSDHERRDRRRGHLRAGGAIIAGNDVVEPSRTGSTRQHVPLSNVFVWSCSGPLIGAALWRQRRHLARAPVSTTHSIVSGVAGSAVAAAGWDVVNWDSIGQIVLRRSRFPGVMASRWRPALLTECVFFKGRQIEAARKGERHR
ncbi:MAG: inorganic phosphate transporter [Paracoccaceae bacterium]